MYGFSIFATVRGPIRLDPRTVYWIWSVCFPVVRILVFSGRSTAWRWLVAQRAWKACGQSLLALFSGFGIGAWIACDLPTLARVARPKCFEGCKSD